jgi:hypothetical protein
MWTGAELLFSLYFRYYTQTFFFVTRLKINKINKVQWVDFKLENVLVSLHSLKTMGIGPEGASAPLFVRNGELLGHSPIHNANLAYRHTTNNFQYKSAKINIFSLVNCAKLFDYLYKDA